MMASRSEIDLGAAEAFISIGQSEVPDSVLVVIGGSLTYLG
jgi:hypothetical protein